MVSGDTMPKVRTLTSCLLACAAGVRGRVATPLLHLVISIDRRSLSCIYHSCLHLIRRENHIHVTF